LGDLAQPEGRLGRLTIAAGGQRLQRPPRLVAFAGRGVAPPGGQLGLRAIGAVGESPGQLGQHGRCFRRLAGLPAALPLAQQGQVGLGKISQRGHGGEVRLRLSVLLLAKQRNRQSQAHFLGQLVLGECAQKRLEGGRRVGIPAKLLLRSAQGVIGVGRQRVLGHSGDQLLERRDPALGIAGRHERFSLEVQRLGELLALRMLGRRGAQRLGGLAEILRPLRGQRRLVIGHAEVELGTLRGREVGILRQHGLEALGSLAVLLGVELADAPVVVDAVQPRIPGVVLEEGRPLLGRPRVQTGVL